MIDRELYLPKTWTEDRDRCRDAGIDDSVEFTTKPELTQAMLERALDAGVPFGWVDGRGAFLTILRRDAQKGDLKPVSEN